MANETVNTLLVEIKAETQKLKKGMNDVNKKLDKTKEKTKTVNKAFQAMGAIVATIGLSMLVKQTVQTIREFEDLEATLRAVTGSSEGAGKAMAVIRDFTKGTTFQIQEVTQAFIRLKLAGVVPTSDVMTDFGNLAAGMGRSIENLAQAAFNATTGEMEMLKQFGIRAVQDGDKITVTFDNVTQTIDRSGEAVINYLRSIGREKFPTALQERLDTLSGAISNMKDASAEFMVAIGEGGLTSTLTDFSKRVSTATNEARGFGNVIGKVLAGAFTLLLEPIVLVLENLRFFISMLTGAAIALIITNFGRLVAVVKMLGQAIRGAATGAAVLMGLMGNLKGLAIAAAAGTATYIALGEAFDDGADSAEDAAKKNKELTDTVVATEDKIGNLNKKYKEFFALLDKEKKSDPKNIFDFGVGEAKDELEKAFRDFQQIKFDEAAAADPLVQLMQKRIDDAVKSGRIKIDEEQFKIDGIGHDFRPTLPLSIDPDFEGNDRKFMEEFLESRGLTQEEVDNIMKVNVVSPVSDAMSAISDVMGDDGPSFMETLGDNDEALKAVFDLMGGAKELGITYDQLKDKVDKFNKAANTELTADEESILAIFNAGAAEDIDVATAAVEANDEALGILLEKLKLIDSTFKDMDLPTFAAQYKNGILESADATDTLKNAVDALNDSFDDVLGNYANMGDAQDLLQKAVAAGTITQDEANAKYREFLESSGPFGKAMAQIGNRVEALARSFSDEFANAMLEGQLSMEQFKNLAQNIVQAVIASFMELLVIQPIVDAILGYFKISPSTGTGVGENASGGRLQKGNMSVVGERGPEIFVPDTHGNILNNMNSRNAVGGGGITVVQNLNFATGIVSTVRQEVMQMLPQIAEVSKSAVQDAAARGGSYRRSLLGG